MALKSLRSAADESGIDADALTERVTLLAPVSNQNDLGEMVKAWRVVAEVWAGVEQTGGNEGVQAGQLHATAAYLVLIRYRAGVDSTMRVRLRSGETLAIGAVENWRRRDVALYLNCSEDRQRGA